LILPLITIFNISIVSSYHAFGQDQDFQIVHSDVNSLTIEFRPHYDEPQTKNINGMNCTRFTFNGYFSDANRKPGSPEVLLRSFTIRLPGIQNNTIEILNVDYEEIRNVILSPHPLYRASDMGLSPEYFIDEDSYNTSGYYPDKIVSLDHIGETRGIFLGSLIFAPLQYDAFNKTVKKYNRIVARVSFGGIDTPTRSVPKVKSAAINENAFRDFQFIPQPLRKEGLRNSVLSDGIWYRFNITEDGMYKITGQVLLNAGIPSSVNPKTIKIYNSGGIEPPMNPLSPYVDDLIQNSVYIFDGGTSGQLDANDYVIFYGKSLRGWNYNPVNKSFTHYTSHFSNQSPYWLTYGGDQSKFMREVPSLNNPNPYQPLVVDAKLFREDDKTNLFSSGIEWLGESFIPGGQIVYREQLLGLDFSQPLRYKINVGAISDQISYFTIYEHDSLLASTYVGTTGYTYPDYRNTTINASLIPNKLSNFSEEQSQLRVRYSTSSSGGKGYIDWYEIFYKRFLKAQNDQFNFHTQDTSCVAEYGISGFSGGQVLVFDVTRIDSVNIITNPIVNMDACKFQLELNAGDVKTIYVVGQNGFKTPGALSAVPNQNLHGSSEEAEYIIITHKDFISAANRLAEYRNMQSKERLSSMVVDVDKIYNEFGGGIPTPVAIRNYLRYVYMNWNSPPKYVLLFGDGDYDYKRVMGSTNPNWIPPWESEESFSSLNTYASDDLYSVFFNNGRVNLGVGRLTVRSLQEANTVVDKIIEYETQKIFDPWNMRVTFVADDGPAAPGDNNGTMHMQHAEEVAALLPPLFEQKKIYLYEYPTEYTSGGRRKPAANRAIRNAIDQGTIILNFAGHGNPRLWTHEAVFVRESDIPLLKNKGKYFFLVAATCNYAQFDMLNETSSGEVLTVMQNAGAIGIFSALRPVHVNANKVLNINLFRYLIDTSNYGKLKADRLGDVVYHTKQNISDLINDRKYFLLADPGLKITFPKMLASIDSINNININETVQLKALSRSSVVGTIRDTSTFQPINFSGRSLISVYDADKTNSITAPEFSQPFTYKSSGSILFRGEDSIVLGRFRHDFIVPKDISYSNEAGRILIYFSNDSSDGSGYTRNILISGTDTNAVPDSKGPVVKLYIDKRSFRPGDVVNQSPMLIADISDSSGVNTSGAGVGHRLEAWLDESAESIDLSEYYKSKLGTYTEGSVEYPLGEMSNGTHKIRVRVWDTYNNPTTEETMFNVITGVGLQLVNVFNYPNPFSSSTVFTFEHNQVTPIDVDVKIYTVAGRMIQTINVQNITDRFVKIPWDGFDRDGDRLANGIYLYKVVARTLDGRFTSEAFGKLSVMR